MSEKSKGDTSRVVNNPLLSASVTGLTFDDFPSAPLLLPAAPPIERSPPPVLDLNSYSKEPSSGQCLESDSDAFSEINLNATSDEDYAQPGPASFISPLEESPAISDSSLLSQAASSFSQLPSVASTVLSTFSKVIKDYSPTSQSNEDNITISTQSQVNAQFDHLYAPQTQSSDSLISPGLHGQPLEPPKFYSPAEIPSIPSVPSLQSSNQNTYRLSAKRKTYAPIPGLSSNVNQQTANVLSPPVATLAPLPSFEHSQPQTSEFSLQPTAERFDSFANSGSDFSVQATAENIQPFVETSSKRDERKGIFSLSNVVAPVWQNISGLVSRGGGQEEVPNIQSSQYGSTINASQVLVNQPDVAPLTYTPQQQPTPTSFFVNQPNLTSIQHSADIDKATPPLPQQYFAPLVSSPSSYTSRPPPPAATTPPTAAFANLNLGVATSIEKTSTIPVAQYFSPAAPNPYFTEAQKLIPPGGALTTAKAPLTNLNLGHPPPLTETAAGACQQIPPPGTGNTFRLQKGTRHYKTPLGISTNPSAPSTFLHTLEDSNFQPSVNQTFVPLNPAFGDNTDHTERPTATTVQYSTTVLPNPEPSFVSNRQPHSGSTLQQKPIQSSLTYQPPHIEKQEHIQEQQQQPTSSTSDYNSAFATNAANTFLFAPSASQYQPGQQNFFIPQQNLVAINSPTPSKFPPSDQITSPTETNLGAVPSKSNQNTDVSITEGDTLNANTKIDKAGDTLTSNFESLVEKSQLDNYTFVAEEKEKLSSSAFDSPIEKKEENFTDVALDAGNLSEEQRLSKDEKEFTRVLEDLNQNNIPSECISTNFAPVTFNELSQEETINANATQPLGKLNIAPEAFSLTNYFAAQSGISLPPINQPESSVNEAVNFVKKSEQPTVNFFSQNYNELETKNFNANLPTRNLPDPISFFDSFHQPNISSTPVANQANENLNPTADTDSKSEIDTSFQIQNFFNNPPQTLNPTASDLNYKLVGSNLIKKKYTDNVSSRAISPSSNVVEPPSSACSEFSADTSFQNPVNLSKLSNVDIPDELTTDSNEPLDPEVMALLASSKANSTANAVYQPAVKHWFYKKKVDEKYIWTPFSYHDSNLIESHYNDPTLPKIVAVEGGRYDVNINDRLRLPIYWSGDATEVRRCSWFYKSVESRYVPYDESIAEKLEMEYEDAFKSGEWHRKISLPTGEMVVFHGANVLVHFHQTPASDSWGASTQTTNRSRSVKRDLEDFGIETGESNKVDHLLFMVHGIGSVCDLKFRTVEEVVDEFRNIATQLVQSHYKNSCESGRVGRVEVLPVSWHSELHSEESGVDEKLKAITLESIPKLRNFTNDTLLDILFYTSPVFCQNIMDTVAGTMNKVYAKYCQRNPTFNGGVSLAGHSLGSLILFDLLCHQKSIDNAYMQNSENPDQPITPIQIRAQTPTNDENMTSTQISYTIGPAGTGQPFISYPQLVFQPKKFFALGSPIGMFVTIRGIDRLGLDFKLPTCPGFYNIFHPYDPVAYRIEALVNTDLSTARPVLVPHHKGRKRMHLELKETMTRVGADIKQKIVDTFKNTFGTVYQLTSKQKSTPDSREIEKEVDKVLEMQLKMDNEPRSRTTSSSTPSDVDTVELDLPLGKLNEGKRIDYVLQEAPLEFFNEYLFALTSHVCYWESADTILFLMKEIYSSLGVQTDSQVPQQSMTIERPASTSLLPYDLSEHADYHD